MLEYLLYSFLEQNVIFLKPLNIFSYIYIRVLSVKCDLY